MSYLLDTNVLSELVRAKPDPTVVAWFDHVQDDCLYISVLTIGEIRKGVESVAEQWGRMLAEAARPAPAIDSLLAATALHHDLRMVTRNEQDFSFTGLEVINPWMN